MQTQSQADPMAHPAMRINLSYPIRPGAPKAVLMVSLGMNAVAEVARCPALTAPSAFGGAASSPSDALRSWSPPYCKSQQSNRKTKSRHCCSCCCCCVRCATHRPVCIRRRRRRRREECSRTRTASSVSPSVSASSTLPPPHRRFAIQNL